MGFDVRLLQPLQHLAELAGRGELRLAAAGLARAAREDPQLGWLAQTTTLLAQGRYPQSTRQAYLLRLLSGALCTETFSRLDPGKITDTSSALMTEGLEGEMSLNHALNAIANSVLQPEPIEGVKRASVEGAIQSGGLVRLMMELESIVLHLPVGRSQAAWERLEELEVRFPGEHNEHLKWVKQDPRTRFPYTDYGGHEAKRVDTLVVELFSDRTRRDRLMTSSFAAQFVDRHFPRPKKEQAGWPYLMTDVLSGLPPLHPDHVNDGDCLHTTALFIELAGLVGVDLKYFNHPHHATPFDPLTGLSHDFRMAHALALTTPHFWREIGWLGPTQEADPPAGLIVNLMNHLAGLHTDHEEIHPVTLLGRALAVYPDSVSGNSFMGTLLMGNEPALPYLRKALERNSQLSPAGIILSLTLIHLGSEEEGLGEGERAIQTALKNIESTRGAESCLQPPLDETNEASRFATYLGERRRNRGEMATARRDLEIAIALDSKNTAAHTILRQLVG